MFNHLLYRASTKLSDPGDIPVPAPQVLITVTSWYARWRLKSPASRLFTEPFIPVQIKENIKAPRHWYLWGESIGDRWIPRTKGQ